jgi:PIN domain nuclease of toxin-antitoxin system
MSYLLDTHIALWYLISPEKISNKARSVLEDINNEIVLSAVCFWEISIKYQVKKLYLNTKTPQDIYLYFYNNQFTIIELTAKDTSSIHQLAADYHRDPFDRMLIWQAIQNNFILITDDECIKMYQSEGLKTLW